jgi:chromosome segregation ATPase
LAPAGRGYGQEAVYPISESRLTSIETLLQTQRSELQNLAATLQTQHEQLTALDKRLQTANEQLANLETSLGQSVRESATLRRQILNLRMRRDELSKSMSRLQSQFNEYESAAQSEVRKWKVNTLIAGGGGLLVGVGLGVLIFVMQ